MEGLREVRRYQQKFRNGSKFERVSVVVSKCGHEVLALVGYTGTCDTSFFNGLVQKSLIPELKPGQIAVVDNVSIHKSFESDWLYKLVFELRPDKTKNR